MSGRFDGISMIRFVLKYVFDVKWLYVPLGSKVLYSIYQSTNVDLLSHYRYYGIPTNAVAEVRLYLYKIIGARYATFSDDLHYCLLAKCGISLSHIFMCFLGPEMESKPYKCLIIFRLA